MKSQEERKQRQRHTFKEMRAGSFIKLATDPRSSEKKSQEGYVIDHRYR